MKKVFTVITILISLSLVGIILIQYSWLKNMLIIKNEQLRDKLNMAEYEVVETLVDDISHVLPALPVDVLPKDANEQVLKMLGKSTVAERFTAAELQRKFKDAFAVNGLSQAKFQFAIVSNTNNAGTELASSDFERQYEVGVKDTANYWIDVWPLMSLTETDAENAVPEEKLIVVVSGMKSFLLMSVGWMIAAAVFFSLIIITAFYLTIRTILNQKKLSEMKSDFINNMTHELRTPLATISIAVDTLKNEKVIGDRDKLAAIGNIIKAENNRMNLQVEQILQAAQLDITEVLKDKDTMHVHEVFRTINDKFLLQLQEKNAVLVFDFKALEDGVLGHKVHFVNMLSNLVDNALKYSKEDVDPHIIVSTKNDGKRILISVIDNGIGMTKDTASKVFDKFYRAHTGNVHNVKGFGLGLNYTRKMVEAHDGKITLETNLGKGSTFTISLPLVKEK
jgi:two-component system phosphate regulon sensor histidine kinase PhoR